MMQFVVDFFSGFPPQLATFFLAMTPVGELRLALPIALMVYKLPLWEAMFWSIIGNMVPVLIILYFSDLFHIWIQKKSGYFSKKWINVLARSQAKFSGDFAKYGLIGLMIFIGIPLPGTGAFTGALAAFVFGIPFKKSWPYVFGGVVISAIITAVITISLGKVF